MEQKESVGAVRVGMRWGGIGGLVAFLVSLLEPVAGMVAAIFVGVSCGRRAAVADAAMDAPTDAEDVEARPGALVAARGSGISRMAETLSQMLGTNISPQQAWQLFLLSLVFSAVLQVTILLISSTAAGAWATRKG